MVSRTHRVTGGMSPGKKRRLTQCLIPHTKYIVRSSTAATRNLLNLIEYPISCCWKPKALNMLVTLLWVPTIPTTTILRLTKFTFSNLLFNISLNLLAFRFVLRPMLVSNQTDNSRTKIVDSFWVKSCQDNFLLQ